MRERVQGILNNRRIAAKVGKFAYPSLNDLGILERFSPFLVNASASQVRPHYLAFYVTRLGQAHAEPEPLWLWYDPGRWNKDGICAPWVNIYHFSEYLHDLSAPWQYKVPGSIDQNNPREPLHPWGHIARCDVKDSVYREWIERTRLVDWMGMLAQHYAPSEKQFD